MSDRGASRYRATTLALLLGLEMSACSIPEAERVERLALTDLLAAAEVRVERDLIDLGSESAHPHLGHGWGWDESFESGGEVTTFVWGLAPVSELRFDLFAPRDLALLLRGHPFQFPQAPAQRVTVELNGSPVGEITLASDMAEHGVSLPSSALVVGRNLLRFRYAYGRAPSEVSDSTDVRRLAMLWDWIRFDPVPEPILPAESDGRLLLPGRSETAFYFETRPRQRLEFAELSAGAENARLELTWATDDEPERALATVEPRERRYSLPLPATEAGIGRLGLRVLGSSARVTLVAPQIVSPVDPQRPPPSPSSLPPPLSPQADRSSSPNIVVYVVDTLRADSLGCYGQELPVTPRIDSFASEGLLFEKAFAQSSWTLPSTASIFSGLRPDRHGVNTSQKGLSGEVETLAERLRDGGYRTAAFVSNPSLGRASGFEQGFERFDPFDGVTESPVAAARQWLGERDGDRPFFLYVHTYEPHFPFAPPAELREQFAPEADDALIRDLGDSRGESARLTSLASIDTLRRLYLADVALADREFGAILDELEERGLAGSTFVLFLSDHGEELFERGAFGHRGLFGEVVHIPFLLRPPGGSPPRRLTAPVQHIDLLPTLLDLAGLPRDGLAGRTLTPLIRDATAVPFADVAIVSQVREMRGELVSAREMRVLWQGWKLIDYYRGDHPGAHWLFAPGDAKEEHDVAALHPVRVGYLSSLARAQKARDGPPVTPRRLELSDERKRQLRALGYLE